MQTNSRRVLLTPGEPAPWFICRSSTRDRFAFDTVAGRYIVLAFLGSSADERGKALLDGIRSRRDLFDDKRYSFFGVSVDPADTGRGETAPSLPGIRFFWDFEKSISQRYGVIDGNNRYRLTTYILDPCLRVLGAFANHGREHVNDLLRFIEKLPPLPAVRDALPQAPVLVVPRVFEDAFCDRLIEYYSRLGGEDLGFVRDVGGKTTRVIDHLHKKRSDQLIEDEDLRHQSMIRMRDRLAPEIRKAFQVQATSIERYVVSCYGVGGHFRPHRDNTTKGTAHRQFAVSLFLNTGDYEGGFLRFPEYGSIFYSAPRGGAVVFSCSLLHEATPVTRGERYMFLPFLYDEASSRIRDENRPFLDESVMA